MKKAKTMPLEEHLKTADDLAIAAHHLTRAFMRSQKYFYKTSRLMKYMFKFLSNSLVHGPWSVVKSELDDDYHKVISDEEFAEHGHIYYHLEQRYKELENE